MNVDNSVEDNNSDRSNYVRNLVQRSNDFLVASPVFAKELPKKIVQFWDDMDQLPADVSQCMNTWTKVEEQGFERLIFDRRQAREFIGRKLGSLHKQAFDKCYHPAMQSDYFRLCYILVEGGCYIDADDVYEGAEIQHIFGDSRLKIQPLCYDVATHTMVPPSIFTKPGENSASWIFYFNNNPLIACSEHPLIDRALTQATLSLNRSWMNGLPEIQSTTGPGNLTKSIYDALNENCEIENTLLVLRDWESIAKNIWHLDYRSDARNWRLSNCQAIKNIYPEHSEENK
jgi:Glycosyltransferase sugar-binding region containing DXD motif